MDGEKKRKIKAAAAACAAAVLLAALTFLAYEEAHRVRFADETMGRVIAGYSGTGKKAEDFRVENLALVTGIKLANPALYETLSDVEMCMNLESLDIGNREGYSPWEAQFWEDEDKLEGEEIIRLEREVGGILESCGQLRNLYIYNGYGTCNLSDLGFLEKGENLECLYLYYMGEMDYTPVFSCSRLEALRLDHSRITDSDIREIGRLENLHYLSLGGTGITETGSIGELESLKRLSLWGTDIAEAGDLVNLRHLEFLDIVGTPLAENEEELKLLREALPDTEIITEKRD